MYSDTCVIISPKHFATKAYAELIASMYDMDMYTTQEAACLSLSRYTRFILGADPDTFLASYIRYKYPKTTMGIVAPYDGVLLAKQIDALASKKIAKLIVPTEKAKRGLSSVSSDILVLPPVTQSLYSTLVVGLSIHDPNWLGVIGQFKKEEQFGILAPVEAAILDMLGKFPLSFGMITPKTLYRAILQSDRVIVGEQQEVQYVRNIAALYGKAVYTTSEFANSGSVEEEARSKKVNWNSLVPSKKAPHSAVLSIGTSLKPLTKLLIKFPTRNRPDKFYRILHDYFRFLSGRNQVHFLVNIDVDDKDMPPKEVNKKLKKLLQVAPKGTSYDIHVGNSRTKVEAINIGMDDVTFEYDVVLLASDDMFPVMQGYDDYILQCMENYFPDTDGVTWFNDGYVGNRLNTLVCMGKAYYDRFDYIYHPTYKSLWCDNEFMCVSGMQARHAYIDNIIIRHEHPANTGEVKMDSLYNKNDKHYHVDRGVFESRKDSNFDCKPRKVLSILIPTLVNRRDMRVALVAKLVQQAKTVAVEDTIEILLDEDRGEKTIGDKRTSLIQRASGEYIMFIDDDDDVADNYVESIVAACSNGLYDVVSFGGLVLNQDGTAKAFVHSLRYSEYSEDKKLYYRPPNHLNAVKRSIAEKFTFSSKNYGEDTDYAMYLAENKLLKSEKFLPYTLYQYRINPTGTCATEGVPEQPHVPATQRYIKGPVKMESSGGTRKSASRKRKRTRREV